LGRSGKIRRDVQTETIEKLERQAKRLKTLYMETEDPTIPADLKRLNSELADAKNRQRTAQAKLTDSMDENDIAKIAARISADFGNFGNLPKVAQKELLNRYVERIYVTDATREFFSLEFIMKPSAGVMNADHCCPVRSRIESIGCQGRVVLLGSLTLGGPVKWAFFQKA
jgi:hypothetical protein